MPCLAGIGGVGDVVVGGIGIGFEVVEGGKGGRKGALGAGFAGVKKEVVGFSRDAGGKDGIYDPPLLGGGGWCDGYFSRGGFAAHAGGETEQEKETSKEAHLDA